ncbi:MAG: hypothetical protein H6814_08525 [Phycisphaeraceae bacterium]|nr:hypothetical protein [Phycisphaeraceae bacterium]
MADDDAQKNDQTDGSKEKSGKIGLKTIVLVVGLLGVEAAVVGVAMTMWAGPGEVQAEIVTTDDAAAENVHELMIVSDRFPNHQSGKIWLWDTEIQIQVKQKNLDYVQRVLEERNAEIKTGISTLWRNAHHRHLTEPNLETMTRQLTEYLSSVFGEDADGQPRVYKVLIPRCVGLPGDG